MSKAISLLHQAGALHSYFPTSNIVRKGNTKLVWEGSLQPSALSKRYLVRLIYSSSGGVEVFVITPLPLAKATFKLPHVYNTKTQKLCLYYPADREWHPGMYFVQSILPWTVEWLHFYELWVLTDGQWLGGGVEHAETLISETDNNNKMKNNELE
jgi:hypothetical protein